LSTMKHGGIAAFVAAIAAALSAVPAAATRVIAISLMDSWGRGGIGWDRTRHTVVHRTAHGGPEHMSTSYVTVAATERDGGTQHAPGNFLTVNNGETKGRFCSSPRQRCAGPSLFPHLR